MARQPNITVGIMDRRREVAGRLDGDFFGEGCGPVSGRFSARVTGGEIALMDHTYREICRSPSIGLRASEDALPRQAFTLFHVTIGDRFHWEREEDQAFRGHLILQTSGSETMAAINEVPLEDYLESVIASEMNDAAPLEFLKAHAILSRSWLLAALGRKKSPRQPVRSAEGTRVGRTDEETIRWYDREDHDLFDVCADDHCQRYQGITRIASGQAGEAVRRTCGRVMTYRGEVCDARYSKACGGITEEFDTAWDDRRVPYLASVSDAAVPHPTVETEAESSRWILSEPEAYCSTGDESLLEKILPGFDRETKGFFRWKAEYPRKELEEILYEKSGLDFGVLKEIVPLRRGPSGRIFRLRIVGSKRSVIVGKELEIRRWLSRSHLYSSAFVVTVEHDLRGEPERFVFQGAGWGHGVGLCQIGAAVMAARGLSAEEILGHYFRGIEIRKIY